MPQYIGYSPWADAANVGRGLGSTLTEVLINLPRLRYQMELNRAHADYYRAGAQSEVQQADLYKAQAEHQRSLIPLEQERVATEKQQGRYFGSQADYNVTRTGELNETLEAKRNIGDALGELPTTIALGQPINSAITTVFKNLPKLSHAERNGLLETVAQGLQFSRPRFQQALGLGQSMYQPVTEGSSLYNVLEGQTEAMSPRVKLGYGQNYIDVDSGDVLAEGRDRPFNPNSRSSGLETAIAASIARGMEGAPPERVATAVEVAIQQLRSRLGSGMPGGGTNAPGGKIKMRKNPTTGKWEPVP